MARSIPRSTAWSTRGGSPPSGESPRAAGERGTTSSRGSAAGPCEIKRQRGPIMSAPCGRSLLPRAGRRRAPVPNVEHRPPAWRRYLRFWGTDQAADVDAELEFHLVSRAEELRGEGLSPDEARRKALKEFGDLASVQREVRQLERSYARRRSLLDWLADVGGGVAHPLRGPGRGPSVRIARAAPVSVRHGPTHPAFH